MHRTRFTTLALTLALASTSPLFADKATWTASSSGTWENPANWSTNPYYPNNNNPTGTTYDAYINGTSPLTITASSNLTLNSLVSNDPAATINLNAPVTNTPTFYSIGTLTLASNLSLGGYANLTVSNGVTLNNNATLSIKGGIANTLLTLPGNQSISGNGTIAPAAEPASPSVTEYANLKVGNLTIGSGITLANNIAAGLYLLGDSLTNFGNISYAGAANGDVGIATSTFNNQGNITATDNSFSLYGTWSSTGNMTFSNATVSLAGNATLAGNVSATDCNITLHSAPLLETTATITRSGGTVTFSGSYAPASHLFDTAATQWGVVQLESASLLDLTLSSSTGTTTIVGPFRTSAGYFGITFNNVTVASNITLTDGNTDAGIRLAGLCTLSNATISLQGHTFGTTITTASNMSEPQIISGNGTIQSDGNSTGFHNVLSNLTIGPGVTVQTGSASLTLSDFHLGYVGSPHSFLNQGTISALTANTTIAISATSFTNAGTLQSVHGNITATVPIANTGHLFIAAATSFSSNTTYTQSDPAASTTIEGTFSATQILLNGGTLSGDGFFTAAILAGNAPHTVAPGDARYPTGRLFITSLSTNVNTTLLFNLSGGFTSLIAPGSLSLNGGSIAITPASASAPLGYYQIIGVPNTLNGSFSSLTLPAPSGNIVYTLDFTHNAPYGIDLHKGLLGDANDDNTVNATDLQILLAHFGQPNPSWSAGNFTGDPTIDLSDLSILLNNMNLTYNPATGAVSSSAPTPTPEPTTLALSLLTFPLLLTRRKRTFRESPHS